MSQVDQEYANAHVQATSAVSSPQSIVSKDLRSAGGAVAVPSFAPATPSGPCADDTPLLMESFASTALSVPLESTTLARPSIYHQFPQQFSTTGRNLSQDFILSNRIVDERGPDVENIRVSDGVAMSLMQHTANLAVDWNGNVCKEVLVVGQDNFSTSDSATIMSKYLLNEERILVCFRSDSFLTEQKMPPLLQSVCGDANANGIVALTQYTCEHHPPRHRILLLLASENVNYQGQERRNITVDPRRSGNIISHQVHESMTAQSSTKYTSCSSTVETFIPITVENDVCSVIASNFASNRVTVQDNELGARQATRMNRRNNNYQQSDMIQKEEYTAGCFGFCKEKILKTRHSSFSWGVHGEMETKALVSKHVSVVHEPIQTTSNSASNLEYKLESVIMHTLTIIMNDGYSFTICADAKTNPSDLFFFASKCTASTASRTPFLNTTSHSAIAGILKKFTARAPLENVPMIERVAQLVTSYGLSKGTKALIFWVIIITVVGVVLWLVISATQNS